MIKKICLCQIQHSSYSFYQQFKKIFLKSSIRILFALIYFLSESAQMTQTSSNYAQKLKLAWRNLSLTEKQSDKIILSQMSGQIRNGDFVTIMGSSGAGKSTFLSLVTKTMKSQKSNFVTQGKITLNGRQYDQGQFFSIASYVPQDDLLLEALTVKETLDFQAQLKLYKQTDQEKTKKVLKILKLLNLYEIRNSFIGGKLKKSISGGQKKRVAIGNELISDPLCLILDEPTSGLDSNSSLKIINILSQLAKDQRKLIIATIHQPSTLMFQDFDKLMVMRKGMQIYFDKACNLTSYMSSLSIKIDERMNPADFLMFQISSYRQQSGGYKTAMTYQNYEKHKSNSKTKQKCIIDQNQNTLSQLKIPFRQKGQAPITNQLKALGVRTFKTFIRSPSNQGGKVMQLLLFPFLLSLLYYDILQNPQVSTPSELQQFLSQFVAFLFIGMLFTVSQTVYDTILAFPSQKQLIMKEVHSNTYFLSLYYITKLSIELPLMLFSVIVSNLIVYTVVGLRNDLEHCLLFMFVVCLIATAGYMLGIITGVICKSSNMAIQAVPLLMMPIVTYGGQVVNLAELPWYSSWIQYISPLRYGFNIIVKSQLQTPELFNLGSNSQILRQLGLQGSIKENIIQLLLLTYSFVVLSFVLLYMRKKLG